MIFIEAKDSESRGHITNFMVIEGITSEYCNNFVRAGHDEIRSDVGYLNSVGNCTLNTNAVLISVVNYSLIIEDNTAHIVGCLLYRPSELTYCSGNVEIVIVNSYRCSISSCIDSNVAGIRYAERKLIALGIYEINVLALTVINSCLGIPGIFSKIKVGFCYRYGASVRRNSSEKSSCIFILNYYYAVVFSAVSYVLNGIIVKHCTRD